MYKIQEAEMLANNIYRMVVEAPRVAQHCLPGQFVIVKADEEGERIPLTICDYDREAGTITIVFMPIGESTKKMKDLKAGDAFMDFVGPLGQPSEFCSEDIEELKKKRIVFVAGGVGTAPVYPQLKWLHEHGITADAIVGAKTKDLVILEKEMSAVSNLYITTDDGSYVRKGILPHWCSYDQSIAYITSYDRCVKHKWANISVIKCYRRWCVFLHASTDCNFSIQKVWNKYVLCSKYCTDHVTSKLDHTDEYST